MGIGQRIAIICLRAYQQILSPDTGLPRKLGITRGMVCCFSPSCSEYAVQAIRKYGLYKGFFIGLRRVGRCHPFSHGGFDPVP